MIRNWHTVRQPGGHEDSQRFCLALAELIDPDTAEALVHSFSALQRFGGELYVDAQRQKFDRHNNPIQEGPGTYETVAYVFAYGHKSQLIAGQPEEGDDQVPVEPPAEPVEAADNGAHTPEAVEQEA